MEKIVTFLIITTVVVVAFRMKKFLKGIESGPGVLDKGSWMVLAAIVLFGVFIAAAVTFPTIYPYFGQGWARIGFPLEEVNPINPPVQAESEADLKSGKGDFIYDAATKKLQLGEKKPQVGKPQLLYLLQKPNGEKIYIKGEVTADPGDRLFFHDPTTGRTSPDVPL